MKIIYNCGGLIMAIIIAICFIIDGERKSVLREWDNFVIDNIIRKA